LYGLGVKPRVAIVTESFLPAVNGVTNSVLRVLESLQQSGIDAIVIAPAVSGERYQGVRVVKAPSLQLFGFSLALPFAGLNEALEEFSPDVIHVASPLLMGQQALMWAKRNSVPSVAVFQTDIAGYARRYGFGILSQYVDRFFAAVHSNATLNLVPTQEISNYLTRLKVSNIEIWGRGVDQTLFHPNKKLSETALELKSKLAPNGEIVIGYVGRLAPEKQVERFQEFLGLANVVLLIVGEGPMRAKLDEVLDQPNVHFVGLKTGESLAAHYAAMDIFVHFGMEETYGQTIQEAQAAGVAVIAPYSGGPKYLIENAVSGFLITPDDTDGYRTKVEALIGDQSLRARISEGGRRAILNKSWEANNQELLKHYAKLVSQQSLKELSGVKIA